MGLGRLFGRSTSSSSTSRPQGSGNRPPLSPGSSKADYADGPDPYYSPTSKWPSKSYHVDGDDAPPPYRPGKGPDLNDYGTDFKAPPKIRPDAAYPPAPTQVHGPVQSYGEDPLLPLKNYDMVIILDDSGSMMIADNRSGVSRWEQAWDALKTLVQVGAKYDQDGIEIHFLNNRRSGRMVKTMSDLERLRRSIPEPPKETYTPTGDVLETLMLSYQRQLRETNRNIKKRLFLVITDGAATDSPEEGIINHARFLQQGDYPTDQVGIQFIQVGNDREAEKFLDELDKDLVNQMTSTHGRDIVDTVKSNGQDLNGPALVKALTGGFNRRQDRAGER